MNKWINKNFILFSIMTFSTLFVATSIALPATNINIEPPKLEPLFFSQLAAIGTNYILWVKTTKVHIFVEQLSHSISFIIPPM